MKKNTGSKEEKKAQTSVEFLILLAISTFVITAIVIGSQQQVNDITIIKQQKDAENSVLDLSSAAKEVYSQGVGAKKQVYITLPSSYEPSNSFVVNRSIRVRARGSDYASVENFDVHGSLPGASGSYWIWVISEGNKVRIGDAMISLSKNSIYLVMNRNTSASTSFAVTSLWNTTINVTSITVWTNDPNVTMAPSVSTFSLAPGATQDVTLQFTANANTAGFYNGEIDYTATDGSSTDQVKLPITVEVVGYGTGISPPLSVSPSLWNESMQPNTTVTKTFTVCTNFQTAPTSVTFTPTSGPPGSWVGGTTALGAMAAGSCQTKILNLTVPAGTNPATYSGSISVVGQGVSGASDTITVIITVGGDPTDIIGPNVTSITKIPTKVYTNSPVTFTITGSDVNRGNNTVKGCEADYDYLGNWKQMSPLDGAFDSITEQATYTFASGFTKGQHTILFRCTDFRNNVGPTANYTLKVMKNFLFATKTNAPSSSESDWITWTSTHLSSDGFNWDSDTTDDSTIVNNLIDTTYYSVIIMADYQGSSGMAPKLSSFIASGGRAIFLDSALDQGPRDVALTNQPGTSGATTIYIVTNNTYITDGFNNGATITVFTSGGSSRAVKSDYLGTKLGATDSGQTKFTLGEGSGYAIWGAKSPANFNANGTLITTRVFDYSLLQSTIQPS
ncbi:hypothetical protein HZC07_02500 [Candidatus Micrarchaeota archaeon]|nr:hypothetical protein [Candidatus Micrarchaeota archaeon]